VPCPAYFALGFLGFQFALYAGALVELAAFYFLEYAVAFALALEAF
jgi:hypothetical protein